MVQITCFIIHGTHWSLRLISGTNWSTAPVCLFSLMQQCIAKTENSRAGGGAGGINDTFQTLKSLNILNTVGKEGMFQVCFPAFTLKSSTWPCQRICSACPSCLIPDTTRHRAEFYALHSKVNKTERTPPSMVWRVCGTEYVVHWSWA